MATPSAGSARYPGRAPIDAYGRGGFRFAGMSHQGSILCLADAIVAWGPSAMAEVTAESLAELISAPQGVEHLILGTGARFALAPPPLKTILAGAGIRLETMDTGAAVRTFNILLAERRPVAAALIAVP